MIGLGSDKKCAYYNAFTAMQVSGLNEIAHVKNLPSVSVLNEIAHVKNFPYSDKIGSSHVHLHMRHRGRIFSQSVIRLKFTKRQSVSQLVSELVTSITNDRSRVR